MGILEIKVDEQEFKSHVIRICRNNTKKPCKICMVCPFKPYVLAVMDENGWGYNPKLKGGKLQKV